MSWGVGGQFGQGLDRCRGWLDLMAMLFQQRPGLASALAMVPVTTPNSAAISWSHWEPVRPVRAGCAQPDAGIRGRAAAVLVQISISTQQTLTIPPGVAAKTGKNTTTPPPRTAAPIPRRTAAERGFSTIKDPASNTISRGWSWGLTPLALWLACLHAVRNRRILTAWDARQADNERRAGG
jgi:hypothetical protein